MADFSIDDLWYLKPGGGQDPTIGSQWLQGMKFGAEQRQEGIMNVLKAKQLEDEQKRTEIAAQTALAKIQTDRVKNEGMAEISAYLSVVAEHNAWTDPKAEAGFLRLVSKYPQSATEGDALSIHKNMFGAAKAMEERAREVDQRERRMRDEAESRINTRFQEIEIKRQRAEIYGQKTEETADWHKAQQAFREAQAETDNDLKQQKLDLANRLADVAERKADTAEKIAVARSNFLERKAAQMERGLAMGETAKFRAQFESLRDQYQFPRTPEDKISTAEYNRRLEELLDRYGGAGQAPAAPGPIQGPPPPSKNPKDRLGLFE